MGAILLVLTARTRHYWRSWLLLGLVVAIGTGFVPPAVTAARRADSAFPRFAASHGYDAIAYRAQPLPETGHAARGVKGDADPGLFTVSRGAPAGARSTRANPPSGRCPPQPLGPVVKLVSRRPPDQASIHETLASFTLQRDYGIGPGTAIRLPMAAASSGGRCRRPWLAARSPSPPGPPSRCG